LHLKKKKINSFCLVVWEMSPKNLYSTPAGQKKPREHGGGGNRKLKQGRRRGKKGTSRVDKSKKSRTKRRQPSTQAGLEWVCSGDFAGEKTGSSPQAGKEGRSSVGKRK